MEIDRWGKRERERERNEGKTKGGIEERDWKKERCRQTREERPW